MNYIIGMLIVMAAATLIATFPLPSMVAVVALAAYWIFKRGKNGLG